VLDYPDLIARSEAVARGLLAEARGGTVALLTGQTAATVVGALAALRAGVPYVVVPPEVAGDGPLLRERGVTLCLTPVRPDGTTPGRVAGGPAARSLDQLATRGDKPGAAEPPTEVAPNAPAYVVYTSGTTGAAKAVVVTHGNLDASTQARREVYGAEPRSFLMLSPFHFDSSVAGLYATLTCGGTLHVVPSEELAEPAALAERARRDAVEATLGLPRILDGLLRAAGSLPDLRLAIGAGEVFPAGLAELARTAAPHARLCNEYGPSEATVWATWHDVAVGDAPAPIGRPIPGTSVYVLDEWGEPLPPGLVGQLAVSGPQVADGYLDAPELTAERFVPDGFGDPAGRLYLTGDHGWADDDGTLHFVGRADDEVKVRGVRVSLADVAAAFRAQAGVGDAEALLDRDQLAVFVAPASGQSVDPDKVLDAARSRLSAHATPARVTPTPEIPRLANGKVDQARLRELARREDSDARRSPADAAEEQLLALFRTTLGQDDLGVESNFFAAGGDSIKAALLTAQLSRQLSTYVYVVALLDNPTPAALAAYLKQNYAEALGSHGLGDTDADDAEAGSNATEAAADELRRLVVHTRAPSPPPSPRLPRPVFVLAPPRSGTTLLRIMLGGHPGLFAPPELELLQFDTLAQRRDALSGRAAFYQEGLVRAVMALRGDDADAANEFVDRAVKDGWSVPDMYAWLARSANGRILVDKTTAYGLDPGALARAEELFDKPLYVHLIRHPQACVASFTQARLDQVYLRADHEFAPNDAAELVWRTSHENICSFLDGVEPDRVRRLHYEELVTDPRTSARSLCDLVGVDFDEAMLDVHGDQRARMSDGLQTGGKMLGDIKFHEHKGINPDPAQRWREHDAKALHPRTVAVARELGYTADGLRLSAPLPSSPRWDWLLEVLQPGTSMLNIPLALSGKGKLDLAAAQRAVRTLGRRHHAFRSIVTAPDGDPIMRLRPDLSPSFETESVAADRQAARADELAQAPFDLEQDSPLRVHALVDGDKFTLLFVVHHIAADAWSLRVMVNDFLAVYGDWSDGVAPRLAPLPRQPADVAADEADRDPAAVAEAAERLRRRLAGVQWSLNLPESSEAVAGSTEVEVVRAPLDAELAAAVRQYAAARGSSLYRTLLGAFGWTLHTWTGDRDFCVGTPALNRGPLDDQTVGLFVTTAMVRLDLTGEITFDTLVRRNEQAVRDAVADAELPFEDVVLALADQVEPGQQLLQVLFSVQELGLDLNARPELRLRRTPMRPRQAKFDIGFIVAEEEGQLVVNVELAASRFDAGDADRLVADFSSALRDLVAEPRRPLRPASDVQTKKDSR
ncbi:MAG: AMP-binding protein, partial [Stackebrandtia sp.]